MSGISDPSGSAYKSNRLPTPQSSGPNSDTSLSSSSLSRNKSSSSTLPSIRSLRRAFQRASIGSSTGHASNDSGKFQSFHAGSSYSTTDDFPLPRGIIKGSHKTTHSMSSIPTRPPGLGDSHVRTVAGSIPLPTARSFSSSSSTADVKAPHLHAASLNLSAGAMRILPPPAPLSNAADRSGTSILRSPKSTSTSRPLQAEALGMPVYMISTTRAEPASSRTQQVPIERIGQHSAILEAGRAITVDHSSSRDQRSIDPTVQYVKMPDIWEQPSGEQSFLHATPSPRVKVENLGPFQRNSGASGHASVLKDSQREGDQQETNQYLKIGLLAQRSRGISTKSPPVLPSDADASNADIPADVTTDTDASRLGYVSDLGDSYSFPYSEHLKRISGDLTGLSYRPATEQYDSGSDLINRVTTKPAELVTTVRGSPAKVDPMQESGISRRSSWDPIPSVSLTFGDEFWSDKQQLPRAMSPEQLAYYAASRGLAGSPLSQLVASLSVNASSSALDLRPHSFSSSINGTTAAQLNSGGSKHSKDRIAVEEGFGNLEELERAYFPEKLESHFLQDSDDDDHKENEDGSLDARPSPLLGVRTLTPGDTEIPAPDCANGPQHHLHARDGERQTSLHENGTLLQSQVSRENLRLHSEKSWSLQDVEAAYDRMADFLGTTARDLSANAGGTADTAFDVSNYSQEYRTFAEGGLEGEQATRLTQNGGSGRQRDTRSTNSTGSAAAGSGTGRGFASGDSANLSITTEQSHSKMSPHEAGILTSHVKSDTAVSDSNLIFTTPWLPHSRSSTTSTDQTEATSVLSIDFVADNKPGMTREEVGNLYLEAAASYKPKANVDRGLDAHPSQDKNLVTSDRSEVRDISTTRQPLLSHQRSQSLLTKVYASSWFDDAATPRASGHPHNNEIAIGKDIALPRMNLSKSSLGSLSQTEAASYINVDEVSAASTISEAKRTDKIDLFLRCTKAEAAYAALVRQTALEREALLDALKESRITINNLRAQQQSTMKRLSTIRNGSSVSTAAGLERDKTMGSETTDLIKDRDQWKTRAEAAERALDTARATEARKETEHARELEKLRAGLTHLQARLRGDVLVAINSELAQQGQASKQNDAAKPENTSPPRTNEKAVAAPQHAHADLSRASSSANKALSKLPPLTAARSIHNHSFLDTEPDYNESSRRMAKPA